MRRLARGEPSGLPVRYQLAVVAALCGTTPAAVRAWSVQDVSDVLAIAPLVIGRR